MTMVVVIYRFTYLVIVVRVVYIKAVLLKLLQVLSGIVQRRRMKVKFAKQFSLF